MGSKFGKPAKTTVRIYMFYLSLAKSHVSFTTLIRIIHEEIKRIFLKLNELFFNDDPYTSDFK